MASFAAWILGKNRPGDSLVQYLGLDELFSIAGSLSFVFNCVSAY